MLARQAEALFLQVAHFFVGLPVGEDVAQGEEGSGIGRQGGLHGARTLLAVKGEGICVGRNVVALQVDGAKLATSCSGLW